MPKQIDTLIIGAGLCGLFLANRLQSVNRSFLILEARDRIGGRIYTQRMENQAPIEMGATWFAHQHIAVKQVLKSLDIPDFKQKMDAQAIYEARPGQAHQYIDIPQASDPSFRIYGGSSILIDSLAAVLNPEQIKLNSIVRSIANQDDGVLVETQDSSFLVNRVVSTLPPFLLLSQINFQPALPEGLSEIMATSHTWMGESIKFGLRFDKPIWRKPGNSGTVFSNAGPIQEMYDHSDVSDQQYALKGFLNPQVYHLRKEERLEIVLTQLRKYYGDQVDEFTDYQEVVWRQESYTFSEYKTALRPHQNNGHPIYQQAFWDGKLFIAGSETANQFPGYMDGAIRSADWVFQLTNKAGNKE